MATVMELVVNTSIYRDRYSFLGLCGRDLTYYVFRGEPYHEMFCWSYTGYFQRHNPGVLPECTQCLAKACGELHKRNTRDHIQ